MDDIKEMEADQSKEDKRRRASESAPQRGRDKIAKGPSKGNKDEKENKDEEKKAKQKKDKKAELEKRENNQTSGQGNGE